MKKLRKFLQLVRGYPYSWTCGVCLTRGFIYTVESNYSSVIDTVVKNHIHRVQSLDDIEQTISTANLGQNVVVTRTEIVMGDKREEEKGRIIGKIGRLRKKVREATTGPSSQTRWLYGDNKGRLPGEPGYKKKD